MSKRSRNNGVGGGDCGGEDSCATAFSCESCPVFLLRPQMIEEKMIVLLTPTTKRLIRLPQANVPAVRTKQRDTKRAPGSTPSATPEISPFSLQDGLFKQLICRNRNRIGQAKVLRPLHHLVLRGCPVLFLNLWSSQQLHRLDRREPQRSRDVKWWPACQTQPPASTHLVMTTARLKPQLELKLLKIRGHKLQRLKEAKGQVGMRWYKPGQSKQA